MNIREWSLAKAWRVIGKIGMYVSLGIGLLLLILPIMGALTGSTVIAVQLIPLSVLGAIFILFAPLHLLVPYTIAKALERSERIETLLTQLAKHP